MLKKLLITVGILISVGVGVTFAAKNPQAVSLSYYFNLAWEGPLVIALVAASPNLNPIPCHESPPHVVEHRVH